MSEFIGFTLATGTSCPVCGGLAEQEEEDGCRKWACADEECGYEFGFIQVRQDDSSCAKGIPEATRRIASITGRSIEISGTLTEEGQRVFLGMIGRRPEE